MATTAKGTPYVESSDLVADYPTVSLALAEHIDDFGGKVLQVVRATDATDRSTTSTSYVDASISVTITPQLSTSAILLMWILNITRAASNEFAGLQITDSSNNTISGSEGAFMGSTGATGLQMQQTLIAYATPGTTSATTYKARFGSNSGNQIVIRNATCTGQLYAIEVSA
jgi:hypothetical protein